MSFLRYNRENKLLTILEKKTKLLENWVQTATADRSGNMRKEESSEVWNMVC